MSKCIENNAVPQAVVVVVVVAAVVAAVVVAAAASPAVEIATNETVLTAL